MATLAGDWGSGPRPELIGRANAHEGAAGAQRFKTAGKAKLVLHLTRTGRAVLRPVHGIALTAVGRFTPAHGRTVTARRTIHLHR